MSEINFNTFVERLEYLKKHPSVFVEEICGIKLNSYQKYIIEMMNKCNPTPRVPMRRWNSYVNMIITYSNMKNDDHIVIATPKKWDKLSKEEFGKYIENYWNEK